MEKSEKSKQKVWIESNLQRYSLFVVPLKYEIEIGRIMVREK